VFSKEGGLVANAPHIPGHLGSMSYAIAYQAKLYGPGELKPGDVLLSNHPISGGTHLPGIYLRFEVHIYQTDIHQT